MKQNIPPLGRRDWKLRAVTGVNEMSSHKMMELQTKTTWGQVMTPSFVDLVVLLNFFTSFYIIF